jgi:hypothetical protein
MNVSFADNNSGTVFMKSADADSVLDHPSGFAGNVDHDIAGSLVHYLSCQ